MTGPAYDPTFDWAFGLLSDAEGGLVDDPRDPGGITNHGISLRFASSVGDLNNDGYPDLDIDGDGDVDADDIRKMTKEEAKAIYFVFFWKLLRCPELHSAGLALMLFDMGVNQGRGPAVTTLQRALGNVVVDGKIGPKTLAAANAADPIALITEFAARRALRYAQTKNFDIFGLGWMRRNARMHEHALMMERG